MNNQLSFPEINLLALPSLPDLDKTICTLSTNLGTHIRQIRLEKFNSWKTEKEDDI